MEREIKDLDREIKTIKKQSREESILAKKLELGKLQKEKEDLRRKKRARLFDEQDAISAKKDDLLNNLEQRLHCKVTEEVLFTIGWKVL